jgi:hypothetical protein
LIPKKKPLPPIYQQLNRSEMNIYGAQYENLRQSAF